MGSVEAQLHASAGKNQELLAILADTDYAPPAISQQIRYISDLEKELAKLGKQIKELESKRDKEFKDHEKYRDSVMKRFAYKVTRKTDKFEAKASKEEQEYFAAVQATHQAKQAYSSTQHTLNEAKTHEKELQSVVDQHNKAQKELDMLYDGIFGGPTPAFPEEDQHENAANQALNEFTATRSQLEAEQQVLMILSNAVKNMNMAVQAMDDARGHSRMDMFGGGTISDMMERSALHSAETNTMQAQMLIMQAQRLSPHVQQIPKPNIAQGNLMSDVLFDNIFTDMNFHEKIKESQIEVKNSAQKCHVEGQKTKQRVDDLSKRIVAQRKELEDARAALQNVRSATFERVASSAAGSTNFGPGVGGMDSTVAPPPAYSAQ